MEKPVARLNKIADHSLITMKHSLIKDQLLHDLSALVKEQLSQLPPNVSYKQNPEFILYVCKLIENFVSKKDNINKKDLCIQIFRTLLAVNEAEVKIIDGIIEFQHANGLISKIKVIKQVKKSVLDCFAKKTNLSFYLVC